MYRQRKKDASMTKTSKRHMMLSRKMTPKQENEPHKSSWRIWEQTRESCVNDCISKEGVNKRRQDETVVVVVVVGIDSKQFFVVDGTTMNAQTRRCLVSQKTWMWTPSCRTFAIGSEFCLCWGGQQQRYESSTICITVETRFNLIADVTRWRSGRFGNNSQWI